MAALPRTARAQDDFDRYINAVVQLYASGESERALEQLERARLRSWEVEQDVLVELYEGLILLDLGQWEQALGAFEAVREQVQKKLARGAKQLGYPPVKPKLEPSASPAPKPL